MCGHYIILTSSGRQNWGPCWKGHDLVLSTWIEKSTTKIIIYNSKILQKWFIITNLTALLAYLGFLYSPTGLIEDVYYTIICCSGVICPAPCNGVVGARWLLKLSLRSLLRLVSWNIHCSFDVYSKPHSFCRNKQHRELTMHTIKLTKFIFSQSLVQVLRDI